MLRQYLVHAHLTRYQVCYRRWTIVVFSVHFQQWINWRKWTLCPWLESLVSSSRRSVTTYVSPISLPLLFPFLSNHPLTIYGWYQTLTCIHSQSEICFSIMDGDQREFYIIHHLVC